MKPTEMAKPFGKRPVDWLRTQQAQDFLKTLTEVSKCTLADYFKPSTYKDAKGRIYEKFLMNREGFMLLAMGFTGRCKDQVGV
ncbi:MAG: Rha family transcriptional regulator [Mariniphaga sp.]|nr:Rha family transcriptional regulator [Mariniphaga sp.]